MKRPILTTGGFYHVYNRGVEKGDIFMDKKDYFRFIHDLYEFNLKPFLASIQIIKCLNLVKTNPSQALPICKEAFDKNTFVNSEGRLMLIKNLVENRIIIKDLLKEDEIKFVISEMEKNIMEHPNDVRYFIYLGQFYNLIAGDNKEYLKRGEDILGEAEKMSPNRQQIYYALAQNKMLGGDSTSALQLAEKAVELDPLVGESHKFLGLIYLQNNELEKGLLEIEIAEKTIDPYQNTNFTLYIASSYFKAGNIYRAIEISEIAKSRDPNNVSIYTHLAALYKEIGDKEKIMEAVKKAVELNPALAQEAEIFIKSLK